MLQVMRKLFVGNMNVTSTKESVTEYFEQVLCTLWNTLNILENTLNTCSPSGTKLHLFNFASLQFGELENVYCPTGKGYAFMTFKNSSGIDAVQRARFFPFFMTFFFIKLKKIAIISTSSTQNFNH